VEISYTTPLRRAWQRMQAMLFRPFHLEHWLVLGFAAFLSNLIGQGGGLFGGKSGWTSNHDSSPRVAAAVEVARDKVLNFLQNPAVLVTIAVGLVFFAIVLLLMSWLSARARFVFLDEVASGRAEFLEPWHRTAKLGRSLFLFYAAFSFAWLVPLSVAGLTFRAQIVELASGTPLTLPSIGSVVFGAIVGGLLSLVLAFVSFLTREFVVPVMLLHDESAWSAWSRFGKLFGRRPGDFVAYTLFVMLVWTGVSVALVVAGVATCCIGLVLMMIPYVGSVLLLPVEVTAQAYPVEFLAQYGPEWDLFAARAPRSEEPGPAAPILG
jgi:hypothetical protein